MDLSGDLAKTRAWRAWLEGAKVLGFVAAWVLLSAVVTLHLEPPGKPAGPSFHWPSLDITVLLLAFAFLGWWGRPIARWPSWVLAALVVAVGLFRLADGLVRRNYYRSVDLAIDLPLLPELWRLLHSTVSGPSFWAGVLALGAALAAAVWALERAVSFARRFLASGFGPRVSLGLAVLVMAAASPFVPQGWRGGFGLFGASVVPALWQQVELATATSQRRHDKRQEIQARQERWRRAEKGLTGLSDAQVLMFFVESYGRAALVHPDHGPRMRPVLDEFAQGAAKAGYEAASAWLDSPTYGGGSWLAHATFATGVRVGDGLEYAVLRNTQPPPGTMAEFFRQAGYRTTLVQPGTTRPWPEGMVHGFGRKIYSFDFEYRGPAFGWAPMPDQFVLDFVERQVLAEKGPHFVLYNLVASHAPWNRLPPIVEDWSRLAKGGGSLYRELTPRRFAVGWQNLGAGGEAFVAALAYDFQILRRYLERIADRRVLVIVLGDHQPTASLTGAAPSHAVPIHVLSQDPQLLAGFVQRGYRPGLWPPPGEEAQPMEHFLGEFLEIYAHPGVVSQTEARGRTPALSAP